MTATYALTFAAPCDGCGAPAPGRRRHPVEVAEPTGGIGLVILCAPCSLEPAWPALVQRRRQFLAGKGLDRTEVRRARNSLLSQGGGDADRIRERRRLVAERVDAGQSTATIAAALGVNVEVVRGDRRALRDAAGGGAGRDWIGERLAERRARVAELHARSWSTAEIAEAENVSTTTVLADLRALQTAAP